MHNVRNHMHGNVRNHMHGNAAWLFLGPEIGEKQIAIDDIRNKLSKNGAFEETIYYAGDMAVSTMVSNIQNGSLFADTRLFFIKSAEAINKKDDITLLVSCLTNPLKDTFIIFISDETSLAKGLENLFSTTTKRIFWELSDARKSEWVKDFFCREGYKIETDGIQTILELVENNTAALRQECERFLLFLGETREIKAEDAEKWLSHTRQESPFTLFNRIAAGDLKRSLESSRTLLDAKEAPVAIFAALASCFRKLINYLVLKEAGVNDEFEYRKIGVSSPGAKRDYTAAARLYDSSGAESCLALTAEYDLLLRSASSFPEQILMDQYLYKIHTFHKRFLT